MTPSPFCAVLLAICCASSAQAQIDGIWTSAAELRQKPMSGPAWKALYAAARQDVSRPDVANRNDDTNVRVLASAIVYARTGEPVFRDKVVASIERLVERGHPGGQTLAWAREVGAYAMAADLVRYRSEAFEQWLTHIAGRWRGSDGRTLREMFEQRPNNWGAHAFGSLCAIYRYLGQLDQLAAIRRYWILGVTGPNPGYRFGDLSWHVDESQPKIVNPAGAVKHGIDIGGFYPDEMRRGGPLRDPPQYTNYAWGVQQGHVMAARILERAGMPIWEVGDRALYRSAQALQERLGGRWRARGDDLWLLAFYDDAYGTNWSAGQNVWKHGKNAGWAYVLP